MTCLWLEATNKIDAYSAKHYCNEYYTNLEVGRIYHIRELRDIFGFSAKNARNTAYIVKQYGSKD